MPLLKFVTAERPLMVEVQDLVVAGWTGRDAAAVEHHIVELEAIGVARPRTTPIFYRVGTSLLTTNAQVDVTGSNSSGEVEFVLVRTAEGLFVGVGSDHTDRKVEAYGVTVSKQICPKPIAPELWPMDELVDHWDSLALRSWVTCSGKRRLYQEGAVTQMLAPTELIARYRPSSGTLPIGMVMYGGTLPVLGGVAGGEQFEIELEDPIRNRCLRHAYHIRILAYAD